MQLKLKRWLPSLDWLSNFTAEIKQQRQHAAALDYNDVAFELATIDDLCQVLPDRLDVFQNELNAILPNTSPVNLLVLFGNNKTAETVVYHAQSKLPSSLIQTLQQQFSLRKANETDSLALTQFNANIIPVPLFTHDHQTVWLLYLFQDRLPGLQQLKWKTVSMERTLSKGIKAWCVKQEKIQTAVETERAIYAAELHDSLAQILGYLKIKTAKLDKLCLDPAHQPLKALSEDLSTYTQCAYHQTRELIVSSRLSLQSHNLSEAIANSIQEFENQSAIVFEMDNRLELQSLTPTESLQILYILRESLSNIVRHSHASHAKVTLYTHQTTLHLQIEDNGSGIDPSAARADSFGLQIMQERAERIGAELHINDRQPGGTRVSLKLSIGKTE